MTKKSIPQLIIYLVLQFPFWTIVTAQTPFTDSNLPLVVIETNGTAIVDEPKVMVELGIINNTPGQRNALNDAFNEYQGFAGIEIRGHTSQELYDKKSYSFETREATGENRNVSLLGLPKENDWVLYGPYGDKSLIRNALAYQIAGDVMTYAPRTRFVELFIDGNYQGVYLLTEKIKRDKNRVNISKLTPDIVDGEELTGGYILRIDKADANDEGWVSPYAPLADSWQQTLYQYFDPKANELNLEQKNYIKGFVTEFENLMASDSYADPVLGYGNYIDRSTFVDYFIVNELCRNVDAYRLSTYFYKDRESIDGRLKMGPVWDFNLAFGNADFCLNATVSGWVLDFNEVCPDNPWVIHFWWKKLWEDINFRKAIKVRWEELRSSELSDQRLFYHVDSLSVNLEEAQQRNFMRWPVLSQYIWPNWFVGDTYQEEVDYLSDWLRGRLDWMDGQMEKIVAEQNPNEDTFALEVKPNPFSENLRFEYLAQKGDRVELKIFNVQGQLLGTLSDENAATGVNLLQFDGSHLPVGIYCFALWVNGALKNSGKVMKAP